MLVCESILVITFTPDEILGRIIHGHTYESGLVGVHAMLLHAWKDKRRKYEGLKIFWVKEAGRDAL